MFINQLFILTFLCILSVPGNADERSFDDEIPAEHYRAVLGMDPQHAAASELLALAERSRAPER